MSHVLPDPTSATPSCHRDSCVHITAWCLWWCYHCDRWLTRCLVVFQWCFIHHFLLINLNVPTDVFRSAFYSVCRSYISSGEASAARGAGKSQERNGRREAPTTAAQGLTHSQEVSFTLAHIYTHILKSLSSNLLQNHPTLLASWLHPNVFPFSHDVHIPPHFLVWLFFFSRGCKQSLSLLCDCVSCYSIVFTSFPTTAVPTSYSTVLHWNSAHSTGCEICATCICTRVDMFLINEHAHTYMCSQRDQTGFRRLKITANTAEVHATDIYLTTIYKLHM